MESCRHENMASMNDSSHKAEDGGTMNPCPFACTLLSWKSLVVCERRDATSHKSMDGDDKDDETTDDCIMGSAPMHMRRRMGVRVTF